MANINKIRIKNVNYDVEDATARGITSFERSGVWGIIAIKKNGYTNKLLHCTTAVQTINSWSAYGTMYWHDVTVSLPTLDAGYIVSVNANVISSDGYGLYSATILNVSTTSITVRISNAVTGSFKIQLALSVNYLKEGE